MSEKPPRRKKKEESPEPDHNPELERLINQAPKGDAKAKQDIQPEQPGKRIVGGDDAWIHERLDKIDSLNFKPGFPAEEYFNETPSTKETVSDNPVDAVLAKIAKEKKLTGAKFLNYLNDMGGTSAPPEAIEKIMTLASKRLDKDVFEKLQTIVSPSHVNEPEIHKEEANLEPHQVDDKKVHDEVKNVEVPQTSENLSPEDFEKFVHTGEVSEDVLQSIAQKIIDGKPASKEETAVVSEKSKEIENILNAKKGVTSVKENIIDTKLDGKETAPENLPGSSPEELKEFEQNLRKSVEDWREKRKEIESSESLEGNMPAIVEESSFVDTERKSVSAPKMIMDAPEPNPSLSSEGAFFSRAQKESLAKDFGVDASIVSHEEAPEDTFLTPEQKKYLSELDVSMPAEERGGTWKPTTRAEWVQELRGLIFGEKNSEGKRERVESLRAYLTKRSEQLGEKAKEYGSEIVGAVGSVVERYNKLNWKTKLAITGALMLGAAYMPVAAGAFTAALYGQRVLGAIGMGMNKRKTLDVKIAANPEHRLAGKSESRKNIEVALWSAAYMAATSLVVYEGVVGLKAAANSEWLPNSVDWVKTTAQDGFEKIKESANTNWLGKMFGHENLQSPEVPLDQVHTVQTLDPNLFAESKDINQLRVLADASFKHLTPNEQAVLDNHIASFTPRERSIFDQFTTEYSNKINAPEAPLYNPEVDEHIAKAKEAIERMQKLVDEQAKILNTMPDGSEAPSPDLPGPENIVPTPEEAPIVSGPDIPGAEEGPVQINPELQAESSAMPGPEQSTLETPLAPEQAADAPFGRDPIDGHAMSEIEAQKLADLRNAMHDPRETGAWPPGPPEEKGFFEKLFGSTDENPTETAGQFSIDSVSSTESHIYSDAEGHLFAHGGSIEDKIETIQKFLTENPDKVIYGTDDSGNYRIPWSLYEGHALPGEPVRTSGFLGFFSSFMDAPKPEEFIKKIK